MRRQAVSYVGSQPAVVNNDTNAPLEYLLYLCFIIDDIHEHFAVGFGELLEFFLALEVSNSDHLNRAYNIIYSLLFFLSQLAFAVVSVQNPDKALMLY